MEKIIARIAIYIRMSTDDQANSPQRQREACERYAAAKGWKIVRVYVDEGLKGWDVSRNDFNSMLDDAGQGMFDAVLIDETSRLSRSDDVEFKATVAYPLRKAGVAVAVVSTGRLHTFSGDSLEEGLVTFLEQYRSHGESVQLARRSAAGLATLATQGKVFRGKPPFGYRRQIVDGIPQLVLGPELEVETVRFIYRLYTERDLSLTQIARRMEGRGTLTPAGCKSWHPAVVRRILRDETYTGAYIFGRRRTGRFFAATKDGPVRADNPDSKSKRTGRDEWTIIPQRHPAIIDTDTFRAANEHLTRRRRRTTPVLSQPFMLSGLLRCGQCGGTMYGLRQTARGKQYPTRYKCIKHGERGTCTHGFSVWESEVLPSIIRTLQERFLSPDALERLRKLASEADRQARSDEHLAELDRERKTLQANISKAKGNLALLDADLVPEVVGKIRDWQARLAQVEGDLKDTAVTVASAVEELIVDVEKILRELDTAIHDADPDLTRALLQRTLAWVSLDVDAIPCGKKSWRYKLRGGTVVLQGGMLSSALMHMHGGDRIPAEDGETAVVNSGRTRTCAFQVAALSIPLLLADTAA